jgi:hypothetical protein
MRTMVGERDQGPPRRGDAPRIAAVTKRATTQGDRVPLLITIGVFVVMLACLPLVRMLDDDLDEDRSMYEDMSRMQTYQAAHVANAGRPVETTVSDGESVRVGAEEFIASPGVTVVVRATDEDSYCVSASNDLGEKASERCSE